MLIIDPLQTNVKIFFAGFDYRWEKTAGGNGFITESPGLQRQQDINQL